MADRKELVLALSTQIYFADFDAGKQASQQVPAGWNLREGDVIGWRRGLRQGIAKVLVADVRGNCTFQKIS